MVDGGIPKTGVIVLIVRDSTLEDFSFVATHLRPMDAREVRYTSGIDPADALISHFNACVAGCASNNIASVKTAFAGDEPILVFGVNPSNSLGVGYCWMVGTPALKTHALDMMRVAKGHIRTMLTRYPILTNAVWSKNTVHINWLRHMGFMFLRPIYNHVGSGETFLQFMMHDIPMNMTRQRKRPSGAATEEASSCATR